MATLVPTLEFENPRLLLQTELTRRIQHNPRYSMRRFAQALGISHTVLSLVLSGKRPLSKKAVAQVSDFFGMGPTERARLLAHRYSDGEKGRSGTAVADERRVHLDVASHQMTLDTFSVISDWYHFAILSLLEIPQAKFEARWMAGKLGISEIEAKDAIERLQRLGLVEKDNQGKWKQAGTPIRFDNQDSTAATRKYYRQLLSRALESLEHDPAETRDFTSMTLAIDPKDLGLAREKIRAFRRSLTRELESRGKPKQVYNLNIQIFPLSKPMEEL